MRGLALVTLVAATALSGCGANADEDEPSLDDVAAATRADPYRFELTMTAAGLLEDEQVTATGGVDAVAERGFVHYSVGDVSYEVRQVGAATYSRYAAAGRPENGWIKDATTGAEVLTGPFGPFSHPHDAGDALAAHGRDVVSGPGEPVDGVPTTHYQGVVPTLELFGRHAKGSAREELEEDIRESGSESTRVEAWAGPERILRRLRLTIPVTEDGHTGRVIADVRFFDFGRPVEVEPPPASEVFLAPGFVEDGPCRIDAAPHSPEAVLKVLREGGLMLSTTCSNGEATILAVPPGYGGEDGQVVLCRVRARPGAAESPRYDVVVGNVACDAQTSEWRERVRTILRRL